MENRTWMALAVVVVAVGGLYAYRHYAPYLKHAQTTRAAPAPEQPALPPEHYPVPQPAQNTPPLPSLDESDDTLKGDLEGVFGEKPVAAFLIPKRIIRNIVATIDSLDREPVPLRVRPVPAMEGQLAVVTENGTIVLSDKNAERYRPFISALQAVEGRKIADLYFRYYPLFQEAYENLGYPGHSFNDRLVQVMDNLLATPDVAPPIRLVRPNVLYRFADPNLEALSPGQKMLIRIGPENAAVVKAKLREIRQVIMTKAGKQ
ncbi:MAG: DUF3014 domain-containing protein [Gammaproteobacteria bacterium]|nr:DUF3014 domain-containing protein [Gammaproteobacteria bacterium]